jgi:hypothetical protein
MTDEPQASRDRAGHVANRPETSTVARPEANQTESGQEASQGKAPEQHTDEHQSNYGGGGENGGKKT